MFFSSSARHLGPTNAETPKPTVSNCIRMPSAAAHVPTSSCCYEFIADLVPQAQVRLRKPVIKAAENPDGGRLAPDRATLACAPLSPKLFCSPPPLRSLTWESVVPPTHAWRKSATSGRQLCLFAQPKWVGSAIPPDQVMQHTGCLGHSCIYLPYYSMIPMLTASLYSFAGADTSVSGC